MMVPDCNNIKIKALLGCKQRGYKAEARVYSILHRSFSERKDIACLWSLKVPDSDREIDFLIVVEGLGFAVVEVKSASLNPNGGEWELYNEKLRVWEPCSYEAPDKQLHSATSVLKSWWARESENFRIPAHVRIIILEGTTSDHLSVGNKLAYHGKKYRQLNSCIIVFRDEMEDLPELILDALQRVNRTKTDKTANDKLWSAHGSLHSSCGFTANAIMQKKSDSRIQNDLKEFPRPQDSENSVRKRQKFEIIYKRTVARNEALRQTRVIPKSRRVDKYQSGASRKHNDELLNCGKNHGPDSTSFHEIMDKAKTVYKAGKAVVGLAIAVSSLIRTIESL